MMGLTKLLPLRSWLILAAIVVGVIVLLSWRSSCASARDAKSEARQESTVAEQLDGVAAKTPVIRQEQKEQEDAVENLPGADQRLPDGFGRDLERVRRGGERRNP